MGVLSREKHLLQQLNSKRKGGLIFEGGPIFRRLQIQVCSYSVLNTDGNKIVEEA